MWTFLFSLVRDLSISISEVAFSPRLPSNERDFQSWRGVLRCCSVWSISITHINFVEQENQQLLFLNFCKMIRDCWKFNIVRNRLYVWCRPCCNCTFKISKIYFCSLSDPCPRPRDQLFFPTQWRVGSKNGQRVHQSCIFGGSKWDVHFCVRTKLDRQKMKFQRSPRGEKEKTLHFYSHRGTTSTTPMQTYSSTHSRFLFLARRNKQKKGILRSFWTLWKWYVHFCSGQKTPSRRTSE